VAPTAEELNVEELKAEDRPDACSISDLYSRLEGALDREFPRNRPTWVRGEVQTLSDRTGHCYIDLVDPDASRDHQAPVLRVKCWRRTWVPIKAVLAREGIELQAGMVVILRGVVDFYRPRAEVAFVMAEVDVTALLGRMAAKRAALLAKLRAEGLIERNRAIRVPDVPLKIGLAASPGTEGYRDFMGQLASSGFAFSVVLSKTATQGSGAARAIARAVVQLGRAGCDLVVVVRGGGSKADLGAFDTEPVARAISTCPVPVWTGVGHTGDESVADVVANRACITPTECGRELVARVSAWWGEWMISVPERVTRGALDAVVAAERRDRSSRERLVSTARHQLRWHRERLDERTRVVARGAQGSLEGAGNSLNARRMRLGPLSLAQLASVEDRLVAWRRLLAAYDVDRQLARGYTLTMGSNGRVVRSLDLVRPGDVLVTRFSDGIARSVVEATEAAPGAERRTSAGNQ